MFIHSCCCVLSEGRQRYLLSTLRLWQVRMGAIASAGYPNYTSMTVAKS